MFKSGRSKTGGRQKGTGNKADTSVRDVLAAKGINLPEKLLEILPKLDDMKQADVMLKLLEYTQPKLRSVENINVNESSNEPTQEEHDQFNKLIELEVARRLSERKLKPVS